MLLFYSPFHTFVHKVLVTAHECGHWDDLERVPAFPFFNNDGELVSGQYSIARRPAVQRGVGVLADSMKIGDPDEEAFESLFGAKQGAAAPGD